MELSELSGKSLQFWLNMAYLAPKSKEVSVPSTLTFRSLTFCEQNVFFVVGSVTHEQHLTVGASDGDLSVHCEAGTELLSIT